MEPIVDTTKTDVGGRKKMTTVYTAIGVAVVAVVGYFVYVMNVPSRETAEQTATGQLKDVSAALDQATTKTSAAPPSANPIKNLAPTGNPIEKTNPFKYEYKNPFE